jgi:hypothetical protein
VKALVIGVVLATISVSGCRQEEPAIKPSDEVAEVGFREEEYVLEMHDVVDLLSDDLGEPPACLTRLNLVAPKKALTGPELLEKARRVVGPAGETTFAHFEVHRGVLIVSLPEPEQALIKTLVRNLRRSSSLFVEFSVTELSEAEALEISPIFGEFEKGIVATLPDLRERIEAVRSARKGFPLVRTGVASGWTCLAFKGGAEGQVHGLHVNAAPSEDRHSFLLRYTWNPEEAGKSYPLTVRDRGIFMVRLPNPGPKGPYALAIQPRLVALNPAPSSGPAPRIKVRDE